MKAIFSWAVIVAFSAPGAFAQETLTLADSINAALTRNPDIKKAELAADSADSAKLEALSEHLPHLKLVGTHYVGAKYSRLSVLFGASAADFPTGFPQTDFALEASLLLFDGFGTINRYRAARFEAEAARLELQRLRFRIEEGVTVRFYQALAAQELAKVTERNIETLEQHLKLAQASKSAGYNTHVDVLRIEAQLEEARAERILAEDNIAAARRGLNEVLGIERDDRPLEGALPLPDSRRVPKGLVLDVSRRADLQAHALHEEAQDRLSIASHATWFPRVTLFANTQYYKFGDFDPAILPTSGFNNAYAFGLRLAWNVFDGGASIARQRRASNAAAIEGEESRKERLASPNDFETWKRRYIYNAALFEARRRAVAKSTESVRLVTVAVRAGTKTHSEVLDAELELFRSRAGVIRAQLEACEALANLELALGHRL